jgi:predicted ArsR family transcriptional regulator
VNGPSLPASVDEAIDRLAPLLEPARRRVFAFVALAESPVSREETAAATGISLALATFHLERLLEASLVEAGFSAGKGSGSGVRGRPAKLYRAARQDLLVSLPARDYRLAAELFADALTLVARPRSLDDAARVRGKAVGGRVRERAGRTKKQAGLVAALADVLAEEGYDPRPLGDGSLALRNCPFEALTERHRDLICPTNLALLDGVLEGAGISAVRTRLEPGEGRCCVLFQADEARGEGTGF